MKALILKEKGIIEFVEKDEPTLSNQHGVDQ